LRPIRLVHLPRSGARLQLLRLQRSHRHPRKLSPASEDAQISRHCRNPVILPDPLTYTATHLRPFRLKPLLLAPRNTVAVDPRRGIFGL
jgi:hypothetical protein